MRWAILMTHVLRIAHLRIALHVAVRFTSAAHLNIGHLVEHLLKLDHYCES